MTKSFSKLVPILTVIAMQFAVAPVLFAQNVGALTHITPVPDGANFYVDGLSYFHSAAAVWPAGSKHILYVNAPIQQVPSSKTQFIFKGWEMDGTILPVNPVAVTADPAVKEYQAVFGVSYALSLVFFDCSNGAVSSVPGLIYVNNIAFACNSDIYIGAGGVAVMQAIPNPGYVFVGWQSGSGQLIAGLQNTVTLNAPVEVYPKFQVARKINLATVPPNLLMLADRVQVAAPASVDWGWDTVHSVGPVSPQQDIQGKWWSFSSWSDGGAANHAYKVAPLSSPDTITATYVPAALVTMKTSPVGLKIKIDGRDNMLQPYNMNWGVNEVHHLEAPAQQTDAQGRIWAFAGWSNGAPAAQDFTVPPDADTTGVTLTATYNQLGKMTLNSSLTGLSVTVDGTACKTPCDVVRPLGTKVNVSAPGSIPQGDGSRSDFTGWTGRGMGDLAVTLGPDAQTFSANYHFMNRFSAASDPPEGANWSVQPASQDNFYDAQATVAVSLTAQPGYRFRRWDGDLSGSIPSGIVAMTAPRSVHALLDPIPYIAPAGISNGAGSTPQGGVAPGSVASIFGVNLAASVVVAPDGVLPQTLGGVTVVAGTSLLPLFFVSPNQINVQLPDELAQGTQTLTVSSQGQPDVHATFTVVRDAPGLFPQAINGQAFAVALHEDGTPVTGDSPARHGELLTLYGTGLGPTDHARPEGFAVPQTPPYVVLDAISLQVGDAVLTAEKAFAAPGKVGVDAIQFRLDDSAPNAMNASLHVTINGRDSNTVLIPIQ